ncbi:hypothetical protein PlfCFBP13513_17115 [Plantibacter flavus]|nr:hypothetical protein PlfCFBP13513_17115 [Plantibacter flavus]
MTRCHEYRMWAIDQTVSAPRRVSDALRTGARLLHQSAIAAAFLSMKATELRAHKSDEASNVLASLARSSLAVLPDFGRPGDGR